MREGFFVPVCDSESLLGSRFSGESNFDIVASYFLGQSLAVCTKVVSNKQA